MSGSETNLDPDEVVSTAARMAVGSEDLQRRIGEILSRIREIDARTACGDDDPGNALWRNYSGAGDGSVPDSIMDGAEAVCDASYSLAENTGVGAIESRLQDEDDAARIQSLSAELQGQGVTSAMLTNESTVEQINELQGMMQNPGATELLGEQQVTEIEGFLDDVNQLAE